MDGKNNGWVGWIYFAGIYMIVVGVLQLLYGFVVLYRQNLISLATQSAIFADVRTYGWALLLFGLLLLLTGFAVLSGQMWARVTAVILAGLAAIVNFLFIPVYPIWSIVSLVVDLFVIYALIAHGSKAELETRS